MDDVNLAVLDLDTAGGEGMAQGIPDNGARAFVEQEPECEEGRAAGEKEKINGTSSPHSFRAPER